MDLQNTGLMVFSIMRALDYDGIICGGGFSSSFDNGGGETEREREASLWISRNLVLR